MKKIVAVMGSYRKEGITDQAVDAVLKGVQKEDTEIEKIHLIDKHIEFCTNCRTCTKESLEKRYGLCVLGDDMHALISKIDSADGLIFASPINFGNVTAVMKKFIERLLVFAYWPWDKACPKNRIREKNKKAVLITSSATPAFLGRILMPGALKILKSSAELVGARVVKCLYFGMVNLEERQKLNSKQIKQAEAAGKALA